jgi:5-methylcytosine-specific restriction endonuclease McrA
MFWFSSGLKAIFNYLSFGWVFDREPFKLRSLMKKETRLKVHDKLNGRCAYCGKSIEYKAMQVDHVYPKCMAHHVGDPYYTEKYNIKGDNIDSIDNLMPACRRCNHYKRSYRLEDFRVMIKTINERVLKAYIAKVALDFGTIKTEEWDGLFYFEKV